MPPLPSCILALAVSLGSAGVAAGQSGVRRPELVWRPSVPLQGSLVLLVVLSEGTDGVDAVQGERAGEPLHFERAAGGFRAVGGVPLDAEDSVPARVVIERAGGMSDTMIAALPVGPRRAPRERLHTAPEFVQPAESLAERVWDERELVEEVRSRAHAPPRLWSEPFLRPRAALVTSGFGAARVFNGVVRSRHFGVDLAGQQGAAVRAANRGVVAFVADLYYSGTAVYLDHGAGLVTGYLHLIPPLLIPRDTLP